MKIKALRLVGDPQSMLEGLWFQRETAYRM